MALSFGENLLKRWDAWSIRAFIILSIFLQAFLILLAPLRKGKIGGKLVIGLIWLAYLLADWVATYTIGLIFRSNSSTSKGPPNDIMAFWVSFLLLHLGGPDSITSYSLEDNELWRRHFFGLMLQVGYTIYVFLKSFSTNQLWLATILVLFVGIVKYLERNAAFYLASFEHFGVNWISVRANSGESGTEFSIPEQFEGMMENDKPILGPAVKLSGNLKRILVGPLLKKKEQEEIRRTFLNIKDRGHQLLVIEIELSLLYEVLHAKLPVIASTTGAYFRMANFGCISVALVSFSLVKSHYKLELSDILLTYGLLAGALILDVLSIMVLIKFSDWLTIVHFQNESQFINELSDAVIERRRWSKMVSQINIVTCHVKDPVWLKKLHGLPYIGTLLEDLHNWRCQSPQEFEDLHWRFILREMKRLLDRPPKSTEASDVRLNDHWLSKETLEQLCPQDEGENQSNLIYDVISKLDYTKCLLVWHIATELCFQNGTKHSGRTSSPREERFRLRCKLLSDYMLYLAVAQPSMMSAVLDDWRKIFKETSAQIQSSVSWSSSLDEKTVRERLLSKFRETRDETLLSDAVELARRLIDSKSRYLWKDMSKVWIELMCYAAINCSPIVHAEQPSKGGELLTLVWLLMNHLGLGTKYYKTFQDIHPEEDEEADQSSEDD